MSHPAVFTSNVECFRQLLLDDTLLKCVVKEAVLFSIVAWCHVWAIV